MGKGTVRERRTQQHEDVARKSGLERASLQPLLLTITDVARVLCLSRTKVYQLIACEGLPTVRFGKSVRVSVWSLQSWIEQREKGA